MLQNETQKNTLFYTTLFCIIAVSYAFYASSRYPALSSDDALNILMAHYYEFPQDLYCWAQDRGGAVIPFISQVFIKGFGMSAIDAVSVSNYLLLSLGYIGFSSLLKQRSSKLLFALIWFLPFQRFVDLTRFPIGVEYSLIGFSLFLIARLQFEGRSFFYWKNHLFLLLTVIVLGTAVWASDLSIVSIAILFFSLCVAQWRSRRTLLPRKAVLLYAVTGISLTTWLIVYAKTHATHKTAHFASINNLHDLGRVFSYLGEAFGKVMLFSERDYLVSIYAWLVPILLVLLGVLVYRKKVRIAQEQQRFFRYIVLDCAGILGVILLSHWVLINRMGRWYFVATYITLALIVLVLLENLVLPAARKKAVRTFALVIVLIGSASTFYSMRYVTVKTLRPMAGVVGELQQLGEIGIIAEYWNAYRSSCPNPDQIKATPHDLSDVRKQLLVDEVFARPKLYVIRDGWMSSFPDTLRQFKFTLAKAGKPFFLGGSHLCRYKRVLMHQVFRVPELKSDPSLILQKNGKTVVHADTTAPAAHDKYILFGPYCSLLPGKYAVRYYLRAAQFRDNGAFGFIDIAAEYSGVQLLHKELFRKDLAGKSYFEVELGIRKRVNNVEFLFLNKGTAAVTIEKIEVIER